MIIDAPDHVELSETAYGWLNLAWEITVDALDGFQALVPYLETLEDELKEPLTEKNVAAFWHQNRYKLNNAIALLQQAIELELKSIIARTSPYLLIVGDVQTWPKSNAAGNVSFSEFRTLDASQLCRAAETVSDVKLHKDFRSFFERVRLHRNKIAHLNAGNARVEAHKILLDILIAYRYLFPAGKWLDFRRRYMISTGAYGGPTDYDDDVTHSNFMQELRVAIASLENRYTKLFLGFDKRRKALLCPECSAQRADWDDQEADFAQRQKDGSVACIACASSWATEEYDIAVMEWSGP
jgi:hypothetical protein